MKKKLYLVLILLSILCNSCLLNKVKPIYTDFKHDSLYTKIDFRKGKWLIANQENLNTNYPDLSFEKHPFKKYLNNRLYNIENIRDQNNKLMYLAPISNNDLTLKEIKMLSTLFNDYDYFIDTHLSNTTDKKLEVNHRTSIGQEFESQLKLTIIIYDLKNTQISQKISCLATEYDYEDTFLSSLSPLYIKRKLLKEIKKNSIYE